MRALLLVAALVALGGCRSGFEPTALGTARTSSPTYPANVTPQLVLTNVSTTPFGFDGCDVLFQRRVVADTWISLPPAQPCLSGVAVLDPGEDIGFLETIGFNRPGEYRFVYRLLAVAGSDPSVEGQYLVTNTFRVI